MDFSDRKQSRQVSLPQHIWDALEKAAAKNKGPRSNIIEAAVENYLTLLPEDRGPGAFKIGLEDRLKAKKDFLTRFNFFMSLIKRFANYHLNANPNFEGNFADLLTVALKNMEDEFKNVHSVDFLRNIKLPK